LNVRGGTVDFERERELLLLYSIIFSAFVVVGEQLKSKGVPCQTYQEQTQQPAMTAMTMLASSDPFPDFLPFGFYCFLLSILREGPSSIVFLFPVAASEQTGRKGWAEASTRVNSVVSSPSVLVLGSAAVQRSCPFPAAHR